MNAKISLGCLYLLLAVSAGMPLGARLEARPSRPMDINREMQRTAVRMHQLQTQPDSQAQAALKKEQAEKRLKKIEAKQEAQRIKHQKISDEQARKAKLEQARKRAKADAALAKKRAEGHSHDEHHHH